MASEERKPGDPPLSIKIVTSDGAAWCDPATGACGVPQPKADAADETETEPGTYRRLGSSGES